MCDMRSHEACELHIPSVRSACTPGTGDTRNKQPPLAPCDGQTRHPPDMMTPWLGPLVIAWNERVRVSEEDVTTTSRTHVYTHETQAARSRSTVAASTRQHHAAARAQQPIKTPARYTGQVFDRPLTQPPHRHLQVLQNNAHPHSLDAPQSINSTDPSVAPSVPHTPPTITRAATCLQLLHSN